MSLRKISFFLCLMFSAGTGSFLSALDNPASANDITPILSLLLLDDSSQALTVSANFSPDTVKPGQTSNLIITITNSSPFDMGAVSINNMLPAGLNLRIAGSSNTCDPTPEVLGATEEYNLTDAIIVSNDQCVITMQINGIHVGDIGTKEFSTANLTDGFTTFENTSATLTVLPADPTVDAVFNPDTVNPGETTDLTVTLSNPNPLALTNISITNDLPAGLGLDANQSSNTCDASPTVTAATGTYDLTNATLPANGDCTITIMVNGIDAADAGIKLFSTANFTNGVDTFANTMDVLTVNNAQPTVSGGFNQTSLIVGQQGTLTYTITNNASLPLTGLDFIINLPSQLDLDTDSAVTNATCDATPSVSGGSDLFALTDTTIAANDDCIIVMTFTTNSVGTFTTQAIGPLTNNETDDVAVPAPPAINVLPFPLPTITGGFDQSTLIDGQSGTLTYAITNNAPLPLTGINFNNNLPSQLNLVTSTSFATCDDTPQVLGGFDLFNLTNASIGVNETCTIVIRFEANGVGSFNTIVGNLSSNETTSVPPPGISPITLVAAPSVYVTGDFNPGSLVTGQSGSLLLTIVNGNAFALTGVDFSINLPLQLDLDTDSAVTNASCDATPEVFGSTDRFTITNATIAANEVCKVTLTFTAVTPGTFQATSIGPLTSNETASILGPPKTSILVLPTPLPTITGGFSSTNLVVGQSGTLSYTVTNTAPVALTGVAFSTNLPFQLDLDTVNSSTTCDSSPEVIGSTDRYNVTDATLAANSSCTIDVVFTTNAVGTAGVGSGFDFLINLSSLTSNEAAATPAPDIGSLNIQAPDAPAITGGFSSTSLVAGQSRTLSYTRMAWFKPREIRASLDFSQTASG